jgi:exodeoxyribonuclease (lambda-induced)
VSPQELFGLPAGWYISFAKQGSEEWHADRKGVCTGSKAKDACDRLADKEARPEKRTKAGDVTQEARPFTRGGPSQKQALYAMDLARAREDGRMRGNIFQTADMREGQVEEPRARQAYELATGRLVEEIGFVRTGDKKFGVSPDGLCFSVDITGKQERGGIEVKTMLSSDTLFTALIFGDYSEYWHQCVMEIWLLHLDWIDLVLWAPDLPEGRQMRVIRIERDEAAIEELKTDLLEFDARVEKYRADLRGWINGDGAPTVDVVAPAPAPTPAAPAVTNDLPEDLFA